MGALNYSDLTFPVSVARLTEALKARAEWGETAEASTSQVMIQLFSYCVDALAYELERQVEELTPKYAQLRSSLLHQAKAKGYEPGRKIAARCTLRFSLPANYWASHTYVVVITRHTQVSSSDGKTFVTVEEKQISSPSLYVDVDAMEGTEVTSSQEADGSAWQTLSIPGAGEDVEAVEDSSVRVVVNTTWEEGTSFPELAATDHKYIIERMAAALEIQFGDGVHGAMPAAGLTIAVDWVKTSGASGDLYVTGVLTAIDDTVLDANGVDQTSNVSVTNTTTATGGADEESTEEIRANYPRYVSSEYGLGTVQDYQAKLLAYPGVAKALVWGESETLDGEVSNPDMAWLLKAVLMPEGGGTFTAAQLTSIQAYIEARKVKGIQFVIEDPVYSYVDFVVNAVRKASAETTTVTGAMISALAALFAESDINFGQNLRASDVAAMLDDLTGVDYHDTEAYIAETLGTGDGSETTFSGTLSASPVAPSTVYVCVKSAAGVVTEYGRDTGLQSSGLGSFVGVGGSVRYYDGAITVIFSSAPASGEEIRIRYRPAVQERKTIGVGDAATKIFTGLVQHHLVAKPVPSQGLVQVYVGGAAVDVDDGHGNWTVLTGTIDYANGWITVTLVSAPAAGQDVEIDGYGFSDDLNLPQTHLPQQGVTDVSVEAPS